MAISKNILLKKMSGRVGKDLVLKQYGDKTVVCKYPDMSGRVLSPKQRMVNDVMEAAAYTTKAVMADVASSAAAQVRLNVTRNKLYHALMKENFSMLWKSAQETEIPAVAKSRSGIKKGTRGAKQAKRKP